MMNEDLLLKELLSTKLRLISKIRPQQKIDTTTFNIVNNNITTSFWRTAYTLCGIQGHSREDLYNLIKNVTDDSYNLLKKYNKSTNTVDKHICRNLRADMEYAKINILSGIKETYILDQAYIAKLEQLVDSIDIKLNSLLADDVDESKILKNKCIEDLNNIPQKNILNNNEMLANNVVPMYPLGSTP